MKETSITLNQVQVEGYETTDGMFIIEPEHSFSIILGDRILLSGSSGCFAVYIPDDCIYLEEFCSPINRRFKDPEMFCFEFVYDPLNLVILPGDEMNVAYFENQKDLKDLITGLNKNGYFTAHEVVEIFKDFPKLDNVLPKEAPPEPKLQADIEAIKIYAEEFGFPLALFDLSAV